MKASGSSRPAVTQFGALTLRRSARAKVALQCSGLRSPVQRVAPEVGAGQQLRVHVRGGRRLTRERHRQPEGGREEPLEPEVARHLEHVGGAVGRVLADLPELAVLPDVRGTEVADVGGGQPGVDRHRGAGLRDRIAQPDVVHPQLDESGTVTGAPTR